MSMTPEAIGRIVNFIPENNTGRQMCFDLGKVTEGTRLVWGLYSYNTRAVGLPGEPLTFGSTRQFVLALETSNGDGQVTARRKLAYATDVIGLGEGVANQVLKKVEEFQERSRVTA